MMYLDVILKVLLRSLGFLGCDNVMFGLLYVPSKLRKSVTHGAVSHPRRLQSSYKKKRTNFAHFFTKLYVQLQFGMLDMKIHLF